MAGSTYSLCSAPTPTPNHSKSVNGGPSRAAGASHGQEIGEVLLPTVYTPPVRSGGRRQGTMMEKNAKVVGGEIESERASTLRGWAATSQAQRSCGASRVVAKSSTRTGVAQRDDEFPATRAGLGNSRAAAGLRCDYDDAIYELQGLELLLAGEKSLSVCGSEELLDPGTYDIFASEKGQQHLPVVVDGVGVPALSSAQHIIEPAIPLHEVLADDFFAQPVERSQKKHKLPPTTAFPQQRRPSLLRRLSNSLKHALSAPTRAGVREIAGTSETHYPNLWAPKKKSDPTPELSTKSISTTTSQPVGKSTPPPLPHPAAPRKRPVKIANSSSDRDTLLSDFIRLGQQSPQTFYSSGRFITSPADTAAYMNKPLPPLPHQRSTLTLEPLSAWSEQLGKRPCGSSGRLRRMGGEFPSMNELFDPVDEVIALYQRAGTSRGSALGSGNESIRSSSGRGSSGSERTLRRKKAGDLGGDFRRGLWLG